jgi:mono/diheme cytochrome c family protein
MRRIMLLLVLPALLGCSGGEREIIPDAVEVSRLRPLGRQVAQELLEAMGAEMTAAMQQGGPMAAIETCSIIGLPLTRELAQRQDAPIEVKRATDRARNPENRADSEELRALAYFAAALERGEELPADHVQKVVREGQSYLRYYQPLTVAARCLACHGDGAAMDEGLRSTLARRYPEDRALGYREGDLRGVFRLEIRAEGLSMLAGEQP